MASTPITTKPGDKRENLKRACSSGQRLNLIDALLESTSKNSTPPFVQNDVPLQESNLIDPSSSDEEEALPPEPPKPWVTRICPACNKTSSHTSVLNKHIKEVHSGATFHCSTCPKMYKTKSNKTKHEKTHIQLPSSQASGSDSPPSELRFLSQEPAFHQPGEESIEDVNISQESSGEEKMSVTSRDGEEPATGPTGEGDGGSPGRASLNACSSHEETAGEADSDLDGSVKKTRRGKADKAGRKKKRQSDSNLSDPEGFRDYKESKPKPSKRRRKSKASKKESPEQAMPTVSQVCDNWDLNNVDLEYSDYDYSNLTTKTLFQQTFRPRIRAENPKVPMLMLMMLVAAKW